ncbi:MAG: beta-N-acetylhexosaminidase, partial [Actinomycetota bacterium]|nr:beta-N-acetylhexosaminidase [Actinomycetota bacterium]
MTPRAVRLCGLGLAALLAAAGCAASPASGGPGPSSSPTRAGTGPGSTSAPATTTPSPAANPAGLTDRELVGQLFTTYVYGSGARTVTADQRAANLALYGEPTPAAVVARWHLGGVLLIDHNNLDPARPELSTGNVATPDQIRGLV